MEQWLTEPDSLKKTHFTTVVTFQSSVLGRNSDCPHNFPFVITRWAKTAKSSTVYVLDTCEERPRVTHGTTRGGYSEALFMIPMDRGVASDKI